MKDSIVSILVQKKDNNYIYGSSFYISPIHIITSCHNIDHYKNIYAYVHNKLVRCLHVCSEKRSDLAMLYVESLRNNHYLELADDVQESGSEVSVIGYYKDTSSLKYISCTLLSNNYVTYTLMDGLCTNFHACHGFSGSPILNSQNQVIGILNWYKIRSKSNNSISMSGGVNCKVIKYFIENNGKIMKCPITTIGLKMHDCLKHKISKCGERILDVKLPNFSWLKGKIIICVNGQSVGYNNVSTEYLIYFLTKNDNVVIEYLNNNNQLNKCVINLRNV